MTNSLPEMARPMPEVSGVTRAMFEAEIRPLKKPVVMRALAADWPVTQAADKGAGAVCDYLKGLSGNEPVQVFDGTPEAGGRFFYDDSLTGFNFERQQMPLHNFLDLLTDIQNREDVPYIYAGAVNIPKYMPDFLKDQNNTLLDPSVEQLGSVWLGTRSRIPPHWDLPENIAVCTAGQRRFTVFPPEQLANLYIGPIDRTLAGQPCSVVDLHDPDTERFPKFAEAARHAMIADLAPGDALYLPSLWLHQVESLAPFGMLVNFWWRDAPAYMYTPMLTLFHGLLSVRGLPPEERENWRRIFDHFLFGDPEAAIGHIPEAARGVLGELTPDQIASLKAFLRQNL